MIDSTVQSAFGECLRMLVVVVASLSLIWSLLQLPGSSAIWLAATSIAVGLRGVGGLTDRGPIGTRVGRSLITVGLVAGLIAVTGLTVPHSVRFWYAGLLVVFALKLAVEMLEARVRE